MLKRTSFYIIMLVGGICLVALGFLLHEIVPKSLQGVLLGLGAGFIGMSIANLYMKNCEIKNPQLAKQNEIDFKDERNTIIRNRAKAKAGDITQWLIIGIAYISVLINADLWVTIVIVAVFLLYSILGIFYMSKYQKEM